MSISKNIRRKIPEPIPVDDYFLIELTKGRYAKVCACHVHLVRGKRWFFVAANDNPDVGYAKRTVGARGKKHTEAMHRIILGLDPNSEFDGDHKHGDSLDNRCCELRTCRSMGNSFNRGRQKNNTSGYKGVR